LKPYDGSLHLRFGSAQLLHYRRLRCASQLFAALNALLRLKDSKGVPVKFVAEQPQIV
jgi:hypothetical protein